MMAEHVGSLVVVQAGKGGELRPIGMLTDRDMVAGAIARTGRNLDDLQVADVMSSDVVTVRESTELEDVVRRMRSFGVRRVPVVNDDDVLQGIITFDDCIEFLQEEITDLASLLARERKREAWTGAAEKAAPAGILLEDYTRARMVILSPLASVYSAARALQDNHIGAVIVHDGSNVVGIVTDRDIVLRATSRELDPTQTSLWEIMTTDVATLPPTASIALAAQLMRDRRVRRIPIVEQGKLLGLVTLDDLLVDRAISARTCAEIIRAQLSLPSRLKDEGQVRPTDPVHVAPRTA
jgi:CBS domain-containing protein